MLTHKHSTPKAQTFCQSLNAWVMKMCIKVGAHRISSPVYRCLYIDTECSLTNCWKSLENTPLHYSSQRENVHCKFFSAAKLKTWTFSTKNYWVLMCIWNAHSASAMHNKLVAACLFVCLPFLDAFSLWMLAVPVFVCMSLHIFNLS